MHRHWPHSLIPLFYKLQVRKFWLDRPAPTPGAPTADSVCIASAPILPLECFCNFFLLFLLMFSFFHSKEEELHRFTVPQGKCICLSALEDLHAPLWAQGGSSVLMLHFSAAETGVTLARQQPWWTLNLAPLPKSCFQFMHSFRVHYVTY